MIFESNKGIILVDCLLSFLVLSTFILLLANYTTRIYELKQEIIAGNQVIDELKVCILTSCDSSQEIEVKCVSYEIKKTNKELCVVI